VSERVEKQEAFVPKKTRTAIGPYVEFKGELHRKGGTSTHYNKPCGCTYCFGICGVRVRVGWSWDLVVAPTTSGQGRIYLHEEPSYAESAFGIDEDIVFSPEILAGSGYSSLILLQGMYTYHSEPAAVMINGSVRQTAGYIDVAISYN
jgi:hypothetical protein